MTFVLAVPFGWGLLLLACAGGLGAVIQAAPVLRGGIKALGLAYMLWLAWKLATTARMAEADGGLRVGFWQGVMLQFVNIKAWMNALMISAGWITVAEPMAPRLAIGFFAGLRSCELDRLTWRSCKLDEGIITVTHTKTSSGHMQSIPRHVTISDNLGKWLEKYRKEADDPIGPHGKRLSSKRGAIAKVSGFAMIENGARHTFATAALRSSGGNLIVVRDLLRHASVVTTQRYVGVDGDEAGNAVRMLDP
jgi:hypothetical protein